ncbi:MAG: ATP-dependent zinc metalloprotease FtsH [Fimbriimonadaceae bacterium]|nr:ATP-dependent zinc metalloprotease FtsH [Fimbriimonadaceae bacterium]
MSNQPNPRPGQPEGGPLRQMAIWPLLILVMALVVLYANSVNQAGTPLVDYSTLVERVEAGQVTEATILDRSIEAKWRDPARPERTEPAKFQVNRPTGELDRDLPTLLDANNVTFRFKTTSQFASTLYLLGLFTVMILIVTMVMRRANPAERAMAFGKARARQYVERDIKTSFEDIAGIDEARAELVEIVEYLRTPEKFRRLGGRIPKGVLLVGAPGTGKTLLAKAVAGEAKVPFFSLSGSDFVELYVGVGASRVRDLFRQAQQHSPCIVFIDELDALGKARGQAVIGGGHDEREQTLNQLLVEMDGFDSASSVILMAATNRPEILDPALLRPGRFDRQVMIQAPDLAGREAILRVHIRNVKHDPQLELRRLAARTPGFVGADLANVVNEGALLAARRDHQHVLFEDFDEAIDRVAIGLERRSQVITEDEKRIFAVHEAGHAVVATFAEHADPVHKVSIIPRGLTGGVTWFAPANDRHVWTEAQLRDQMACLLGGRVAEQEVLGTASSGASNDIQRVTHLAQSMIVELGMSADLGPINYDHGSARRDPFGFPLTLQRAVSESTAQQIDAEVRRLVEEAEQRARKMLVAHRAELDALTARLLEVETVDRDELRHVLGLPPIDEAAELAVG